jgi:VanZ family protein
MMLGGRVIILVTISYAAFIFYSSSLPSVPIPSDHGLIYKIFSFMKGIGLEFLAYPFYPVMRYTDKFFHLLLYMGFGILLNASFRQYYQRQPAACSLIAGTLYGISDEIHQIFVPGRTASFLDLSADIAGLVFAQIIVSLYFMLMKFRKSSSQ